METTNYQPSTINQQSSDEISLKELIQKLGDWYRYLKTQWWKIVIAGILGGALGFVYAWMQPITYTAKTTFVVEDAKSGPSLGGLASLAGQFGVDLGGSSSNGLFSGDNIILYFKSPSLAREVLLSRYDNRSNITIADVYAEVYKLKESWKKNKKIGNVSFKPLDTNIPYSRLQDSLLQKIVESILADKFLITKTDKKAGFIDVAATMENEVLAKKYCERIVEYAVNKYISVKTQRQKNTVDKLQKRVDSIASLLNLKTYSSANLQIASATMDINPLYKSQTLVATESTVRDKTMLSTIFASVVQNLEIAKFSLSQETPVIQIVDAPGYPLKRNKFSRLKMGIIYSIVFGFFYVTFLITKRVYKQL